MILVDLFFFKEKKPVQCRYFDAFGMVAVVTISVFIILAALVCPKPYIGSKLFSLKMDLIKKAKVLLKITFQIKVSW